MRRNCRSRAAGRTQESGGGVLEIRMEGMTPSRSGSRELQAVDALLRSGGLQPGRRSLGGEGMKRRGERNRPVELPPQKPRRQVKSQVEIVQAQEWEAIPWLVHGFSTRTGGVSTAYRPGQRAGELNLGFTESDSRD